tara:strand:+ start:12720 stop:14099 length:1380 start_codon:yes stop_codon:yes gene_type:complete
MGIEVHIQLTTNTKLMCSCNANWQNKDPNTVTCNTCLALPGSKPTLNKKAIEYGVKIASALNCKIPKNMLISRKNYFYVDLPSNFQRTQFEVSLGEKGVLEFEGKKVGISRINLEEDPGRIVYEGGDISKAHYSLIDYNRAGVPLCEIVTEPVFKNPNEVRDFLKKLTTLLEYLDVFNSKLDGTMRVDANISTGGERVELKNITSFKDIEKALTYEIQRQEKEKPKIQETRGWDSVKGKSVLLRKKETEDDYGFIIDTDLVNIEITKDILSNAKKEIPELAHEKVKRYLKEFKLDKKDAEILSQEYRLAVLFEKIAKEISPILAARWLRRELLRVLNYNKKTIHDLEIDEKHLIDLLNLVEKNQITDTNAQKILEKLIDKPFDVKEYVKKQGLKVISKEGELGKICDEVLKKNKQAIEDYKKGEEKALNFIVGQVMRETKGQAKPEVVRKILIEKIKIE